MTPQEAILSLKIFRNTLANGGYVGGSTAVEEYDVAIEALERRVPQRPLRGGNHYDPLLYWICPQCAQIVGVKAPKGNFNRHYGDYCRDCGQAIDWDSVIERGDSR